MCCNAARVMRIVPVSVTSEYRKPLLVGHLVEAAVPPSRHC
jgi:hypothetical protein